MLGAIAVVIAQSGAVYYVYYVVNTSDLDSCEEGSMFLRVICTASCLCFVQGDIMESITLFQ